MPCDGRDIQWFGDACGCVDGAPGGLAGVSGGCSAFFFTYVVPSCVNMSASVCAHGSLCGVLRGVESLVCVLGRLRRESPRGARTGRFTLVSGSRGVARFLRRCYFVAMVVASPVGCGAHVLAGWTVRVVFAYAFPCE